MAAKNSFSGGILHKTAVSFAKKHLLQSKNSERSRFSAKTRKNNFCGAALCLFLAFSAIMSFPAQSFSQDLLIRAYATFKLKAINGDVSQGEITYKGQKLSGSFSVSLSGRNVTAIFNGEKHSGQSISIHAGGKGIYLYGKNAQKRLYRGPITFSADSLGYLKIINRVNVEEYLPGVLTGEIGDLKQPEAFKAQAVTARTYTLTLKNNHIKEGYNLCDSPHCQVYYGLENIKPKAADAVEKTKGMILTYNGKPAATFYHASCGGYTEDMTNVWNKNKALPYLVSVRDGDNPRKPYCAIAPKLHWKTKIYFTGLTRIARNCGWITPQEEAAGIRIFKSGELSGRAHELELYTRERRMRISATDFYHCVGRQETWKAVKSCNFKIIQGKGYVILDGKGSGHGVGMCQWGAEGMARQGFNYKQILYHYYPGTVLKHD